MSDVKEPKVTKTTGSSSTKKQIEPKKATTTRRKKVDPPQLQMSPSKDEVNKIVNDVADRNDLRRIMSSMLPIIGANNKRDSMSLIAQSITASFEKYREAMSNHISTTDVEFTIEMDELNNTVNSVMFTEGLTGQQQLKSSGINVQIDYFTDLYKNKKELDIPKRYLKYDYVEYKYNVSNIIQYYIKRFPEIIDLFDVFSDICVNKSDIGVFIEFTDEFIKQFFIDEYQKKLEEQQQIDAMMSSQEIGMDQTELNTDGYSD